MKINDFFKKIKDTLFKPKGVEPYISPDRNMKEFEKKVNSFPAMKLNDELLRPIEDDLLPGDIILLYWLNNRDYYADIPLYFEYEFGINTSSHKELLITKGFLEFASPSESLSALKIPELKEILRNNSLKLSGKKSELVFRIKENLNEKDYKKHNIKILKVTSSGLDLLSKYETLIWAHKNKSGDGIISPLNALAQSKEEMLAKEKLTTSSEYIRNKNLALVENSTSYEFMATLDKTTCLKCGQLDGKTFNSSNLENIPPLHDGCRCDVIFNYTNDVLPKTSKRWSRNPLTNKGEIISNKPYIEWRNELVKKYGEDVFN